MVTGSFQRQPGFEYTPVTLAKVASYIVQSEDGNWTVFAFMYSLLLELDGEQIDEAALLDAAEKVIESHIDAGVVRPRDQLTFEYRPGGYDEVSAPRWWIAAHR